jgi:hypothetical protein
VREDKWLALSSVERLCYEQARRQFVDAGYQLAMHTGAAQVRLQAARPGDAPSKYRWVLVVAASSL